MFTNPRDLYYESDTGYSVEIEHPHHWPATTMYYREAGKSMRIWAEFYAKGYGIGISANTLRGWESPHQDEPVNDELRKRIIHNIRSILEHYKMPLDVVDSSSVEGKTQREFWEQYDAMMRSQKERRSQRQENKSIKAQKLANYLIVMVVVLVIVVLVLYRIIQETISVLSLH